MLVPNSVLLLKSQISEEGPDKYEAILKAHNFEVLRDKLAHNAKYSGLILSSPRCVEAVRMALADNSCSEQWKAKHNFVVGEATYKAALEKLSLDCVGKESGNAANLAKVIIENKLRYFKPFLFPHGNLKTDTLNLELDKEKLVIDCVEVYDTIANPNIELDLAKVTDNFQSISEYVVLFSPSGFNSSIELLRRVPIDLPQIKFVAIGAVTEMAIAERDLPVYGVARRPNPDELLNVILNK